jgi:hypothetical protein
MQKDMNKLFDQTQQQLDLQSEQSKEIMRSSARQLMKLKQRNEQSATNGEKKTVDVDKWDIEYEEE